ncbi:DNA-3-methyladenine glycosylase I [Candidatus Woesearchaeota archaeon]|nr:DNA-3-methyladenine glycosylase I [Candidatus Woesearchaeota archaeon]
MTPAHRGCPWPGADALMLKYHDEEWGVPVHNDKKLFEFLVLESAQAGLSWSTILKKRKNYRNAFHGFEVAKVAKYGENDFRRLMSDAGIVRNRLKILAAINNAKRFLEVQKEFGSFSKYMWSWVRNKPITHHIKTLKEFPQFIDEAIAWSKDLKMRGFKFLGPPVVYAHMQAVGMVNDHVVDCFRYKQVSKN